MVENFMMCLEAAPLTLIVNPLLLEDEIKEVKRNTANQKLKLSKPYN